MNPTDIADGLIQFVIFLFSTTCHEASHALAAKLGGDPTAFNTGQVSLNPVPHIRREPIGMLVMPILCFVAGGFMIGWASTPFDPYWARRYPRKKGLMSLAGPAANFTLMLIAAAILNILWVTGAFRYPALQGTEFFFRIAFFLNLLLGIFNLLPIPPLDGFSALALFLPEQAALKLFDLGIKMRQFSFLLLLIGWQYAWVVINPLRALAVHYLLPLYR